MDYGCKLVFKLLFNAVDTIIRYNQQQLSLRNGLDGNDCWIAYKGKIYDVTASALFKNGRHYRHPAGADLTQYMGDAPHLEDVLNTFRVVGLLEN